MSNATYRDIAKYLLTQLIFIILGSLFVLSQVFLEWTCPLWVCFAFGAVVIFPLSSFLSFRIMLKKDAHMHLRRSDD